MKKVRYALGIAALAPAAGVLASKFGIQCYSTKNTAQPKYTCVEPGMRTITRW